MQDHSTNGLRSILEASRAEAGLSMSALTVLATQNDPFRVDTPSGHRDGEWLAMHAMQLGLGDRVIHLRGLHYMLVSGEVVKPNGTPYMNTDRDWEWMSEKAAKAARWLGYIRFEQIKDARSTPPIIRLCKREAPWPYLSTGVEVAIPDANDLEPTIEVEGFTGLQPYKLVIYGEKSSLDDVVGPIAEARKADLYLSTGEISNSHMYLMAKSGAEDGRPMIVFTLSDCDPAGWQMPISIGRTLQGFRAHEFPELEFQVHRIGLTPDHVREHGLPSTPLKDTERRADKWIKAKGVEQTEIDALAALQPELLDRMVRQAIEPFFDTSLERRVREAKKEWLEEAQARLAEQLDQEELDRIRVEAAEKLGQLRAEIDAINDALHIDIGEIDLPEVVVPEAELNGGSNGLPLIDSGWSWVEQTMALKESKGY